MPDIITAEVLQKVMPHLTADKVQLYLPYLAAAFSEFEVNTPLRVAAFLAQVAEESAELRYMEEVASGKEYEGRKDLGNIQPGDGPRYKGRGPIQLTGRSNYRRYGTLLSADLEGHPEVASTPAVAFRIAGCYWKSHGLNELADQKNFREITHRINGGYLGEDVREAYYQKALAALSVV